MWLAGSAAAAQTDSLLVVPAADSVFAAADSVLTAAADSVAMTYTPNMPGRQSRKDGFMPDPVRAMWLGIAFPGGGQIYNRKFWKLPVFYGGFLGCMYALTWNNLMLRDYSQAYLDIMDDDPATASYQDMLPLNYSIEGKEERFQTIFKNKKNKFRKYRDLSVFSFIGVYALSIIDAYVDAELSSFDISRDLSMHLEPAVIDTPWATGRSSYGIAMNINF